MSDSLDDQFFNFIDEPATPNPQNDARPWRILIVDDEPDVHLATRFSLTGFSFKDRQLEILSAYSGAQALAILSSESDIALVFLDVVMETDDAGLRVAHDIRNKLHNHQIRIVLRTGQPGQAPEESIIVDYDINDYKAKAELTSKKIFTTVVASLRAYDGLVAIERNRLGLIKILEASGNLYEIKSLRDFASGVLHQIGAILDIGANGVLCVLSENTPTGTFTSQIIAATGDCSHLSALSELPSDHAWAPLIQRAISEHKSQFDNLVDVLFVHTKQGHKFAVVVTPPWPLTQQQRDLLIQFCNRISVAFDNQHTYDHVRYGLASTVSSLAELAEPANDVQPSSRMLRDCRLAKSVAQKLRSRGLHAAALTDEYISLIGLASILHKVGNPSALKAHEFALLQPHATALRQLLDQAACLISDDSRMSFGSTLPVTQINCGDESPAALTSRILCAVDALNSHTSTLSNGSPSTPEQLISYLKAQCGDQFDDAVALALLELVDGKDI